MIGVWLWLFNSDGLIKQPAPGRSPRPIVAGQQLPGDAVIALFATWKQLGFYVLLYLAAIKNIPEELYEAAKVDRAGTVKRFTAITLPGSARPPPWW